MLDVAVMTIKSKKQLSLQIIPPFIHGNNMATTQVAKSNGVIFFLQVSPKLCVANGSNPQPPCPSTPYTSASSLGQLSQLASSSAVGHAASRSQQKLPIFFHKSFKVIFISSKNKKKNKTGL
ncbi:hypothetical protein AMECASPLE_036999 [Ameca splendens]|uniref:Uncharacterized protein n=1 Tax=Ameca splendens TaxID=208324 RepID=A0ABV0Y8F1_9TELE